MPVRVPFSKSTVFEICRQKMCRFRVNGRPIRHIFHRFQNVPASCDRSLRFLFDVVLYKVFRKTQTTFIQDSIGNDQISIDLVHAI